MLLKTVGTLSFLHHIFYTRPGLLDFGSIFFFFFLPGHLTSKSDVYSFGVVLLEILTGRRSMDKKRPSGEQNLVAWARPYLADKRKLYHLVDPRLELNYSLKGVQKVSQLAYSCLSRDPKSRPTMDEIVKVLTPLQDLNDLAILSYHSRLSQQGRRKKKSDGTQQLTYTQSKSIRDSPLHTGKHNRWRGALKIIYFDRLSLWNENKGWDDAISVYWVVWRQYFKLCIIFWGVWKFARARGTMEEGNLHQFFLFYLDPFTLES